MAETMNKTIIFVNDLQPNPGSSCGYSKLPPVLSETHCSKHMRLLFGSLIPRNTFLMDA